MKRIGVVVAVSVWFAVSSAAGPLRLDALSQVRAALGGDSAITAVQTIRARGHVLRQSNRDNIELAAALPDRFVRIIRYSRAARSTEYPRRDYDPATGSLRRADTEYQYFGSGDEGGELASGFSRDVGIPTNGRAGGGPRADASSSSLDNGKARFAEFVLPLLAGTSTAYPVTTISESDAIVFTASATRSWRLELDTATHLPARMTWKTPPSPTAAARPGATEAAWSAEFSDFAAAGGLTWPRRILTRLNGNVYEDTRIERYEINVKLSDKTFRK